MESCACLKEMVELWLHGIVAYIEGLILIQSKGIWKECMVFQEVNQVLID